MYNIVTVLKATALYASKCLKWSMLYYVSFSSIKKIKRNHLVRRLCMKRWLLFPRLWSAGRWREAENGARKVYLLQRTLASDGVACCSAAVS